MMLRTARYIVVCTYRGSGTVRVVGPFETQDEAVTWAHKMRYDNKAWDYAPDVLQVPPRVD